MRVTRGLGVLDIGVGIRIGDMGQLNSLVPLELGGWYAP